MLVTIRPYGHRSANTRPSRPATSPPGPPGASQPSNATARDWLSSPSGPSVDITFLGTAPLFAEPRAYSGGNTDWIIGPAGSGDTIIPAAEKERLQKLVHAGIDFPLLYFAHEIPIGRIAMPGEMTNAARPQPVTLDPQTAAQAIGSVPPPAGTSALAERLAISSQRLLDVLRAAAPIAGAIVAAPVVIAAAPFALAGAVLAAGLDPIVFGVIPAGDPVQDSPLPGTYSPNGRGPVPGRRQLGPTAVSSLSQLDLSVGRRLRRTTCPRGLGRPEHSVAFDGHAVGVLDGAEAGGYPGFAGGDGLAVAAAVGAFGQGLAVALDFADVGFAFVGVGGDGEDGGAGGGGVQDEGDGLAFGVAAGQGDGPGPVGLRPRPLGVGSAVLGPGRGGL